MKLFVFLLLKLILVYTFKNTEYSFSHHKGQIRLSSNKANNIYKAIKRIDTTTNSNSNTNTNNTKKKRLKSLLTSRNRDTNTNTNRLQHDDDYYKKLLQDSGINIDDITTTNDIDNDDDDDDDLEERGKVEANLLKNTDIISLNSNNDDSSIIINDNGVIRIDKILSLDTCNKLLEIITKELETSIHDVQSGKVDVFQRFSNLLSNNNRYDFKLPIDNIVIQEAIKEMVNSNSILGNTLLKIVGKDSELFEVASFYTYPGSSNQVIHSDTIFTKKPVLYTITVALQDVSLEMGPTLFFPRTHKKLYHNKFYHDGKESKNKLITEHNKVYSLLSTGDCALYDSRVLHAGTANKSLKPRVLFYISFINANGKNDDELDENSFYNVASIRPEYIGKYTLSSFQ